MRDHGTVRARFVVPPLLVPPYDLVVPPYDLLLLRHSVFVDCGFGNAALYYGWDFRNEDSRFPNRLLSHIMGDVRPSSQGCVTRRMVRLLQLGHIFACGPLGNLNIFFAYTGQR